VIGEIKSDAKGHIKLLDDVTYRQDDKRAMPR
jgi:hypothetical protein